MIHDMGRPPPELESILRPASLAVIGATERAGSVGRAVLDNILRGRFRGKLYLVNPKHRRILGRKAFPSVEEIPGDVDAAIIIVPASAVEGVLEACGRKGIRGATVLSAGFRECGRIGQAYETALIKSANTHSMAILGPNCLGFINTEDGIRLNATFSKRLPKPGNISFVSQSGALGVYALEFAATHGIGLRMFASIGNKAVLQENHFLEAFAEDPGTKVILAYLEDFHRPGEFLDLAAAVASAPDPKPIVLLTGGTGKSGRKASASHTGALAERCDFLDDLCAQYGIIRAASLEAMFDHALFLTHQPLPLGARLAVVTNAGGPAILAVDEAEKQGLTLSAPSRDLHQALLEELPPAAGLGNPIDLLGDAGAQRYSGTIATWIGSGETDAVLAICTPQTITDTDGIAAALADLAPRARSRGLPMLAVLPGFHGRGKSGKAWEASGIPNFEYAESAVRSLAAAYRHLLWRNRSRSKPEEVIPDRAIARSIINQAELENRPSLTGWESQETLKAYGFPLVEQLVVSSARQLDSAAAELGYPVVAKIESPLITHKMDVGGVVLGIGDPHVLKKAFTDLMDGSKPGKSADSGVTGVLLQKMVPEGLEIMIGARRHPRFGTLLVCGMGGTMVEVFHDIRFRRAPLNQADVEEMIHGTKIAAALGAFRGRPARDVSALRDCIFRLSWLMEDFPSISEVDLNPVFALEHGALVADVRIFMETDSTRVSAFSDFHPMPE